MMANNIIRGRHVVGSKILKPFTRKVVGKRYINPLSILPREFSGIGFFAGVITEQNRPVNGAIIQVVHTETNKIARETTTSVDGTFTIQQLDETQEYHIVAIDPNGVWENKVSSRRYPRTTL